MYLSTPKHMFIFVIFQRHIYFSNRIYLNVVVCMQTDGVNLKFIQANLLWKQKSFHKIDIRWSPSLSWTTSISQVTTLYPNILISLWIS